MPQQPLPLVQQQPATQLIQQVQLAPKPTQVIKTETTAASTIPQQIQHIQAPDVSALLEAAVSQQEAQAVAQAAAAQVAHGAHALQLTSEPPAVANEEEISHNIVHTS